MIFDLDNTPRCSIQANAIKVFASSVSFFAQVEAKDAVAHRNLAYMSPSPLQPRSHNTPAASPGMSQYGASQSGASQMFDRLEGDPNPSPNPMSLAMSI